MGTDIHGVIEVKLPAVSEWQKWIGEWHVIGYLGDVGTRHYDLFGYLFGVRGGLLEGSIAEERGLPDDVAGETLRVFYKHDPEYSIADWHSQSWVDWGDVEPHMEDIKAMLRNEQEREQWLLVLEMMAWMGERYGKQNVRMVVWFEN